jgi:N-acetylmuramoyl-L-alanine amidase
MNIDTASYKSKNYNDRPANTVIDSLVIHTTEGHWDSDATWMCNPTSKVSTHFVISPTGGVYQLVNPVYRAWHAGDSYYADRDNWNDFSIGIEISHLEGENYTAEQHAALDTLSRNLITGYFIPPELVVTHRWIATNPPGRKHDPTDWSDSDFHKWVEAIYSSIRPVDPLKVRSIIGIDRLYYCGVGFYDAYYKNNGLWWAGYPTSDEKPATSVNGESCTYMSFERLTLKYDAVEGVRTALLSEIITQDWL